MFKAIAKLLANKKEENPASEIISNGVIRISDLVPVPLRDEFLSDAEKLAKIDELKKEYLKTLRLTRTITSIDLLPEELHNYGNIYCDLLLNIFEVEDNSDVSFVTPNDIIDEKLDLSIKCFKLCFYLEKVRELIIEAKLRLIALNELLNERILSKNKKNVIINEINNLQYLLHNFNIQEMTMLKAMHNNLTNISTLEIKTYLENINNPNISEAEEEVITKRLRDVREMALLVIPDILGYLESLNLNPKVLIASLEQELEMYVYTHKSDLTKLREEAYKIYYNINSKVILNIDELSLESLNFIETIDYIKRHRVEYLDRIKELELRYKMFSIYGRNLVTEEEIKDLYKCKFHVLTVDILGSNFILPESITYSEQEIYQEIVFDLINKLVNQECSYVRELAIANNIATSKIIKLIIKYFKEENEDLDPLKILQNSVCLSFLLALFKENGLEEFYTKILEDKSSYLDFALSDIFTWTSSMLPLKTIYKLIEWHAKARFRETPFNDTLYEIYKLIVPTENSSIYKLPEGIWSVSMPINILENKKAQKIIDIIREEAKGKTVILPKSMKQFSTDLLDDSISGLVLNEGLESIEGTSLKESNITSITIPSSLKVLKYNTLPFEKLETITFNNYQNSATLNDDSLLEIIIGAFYQAEYIEKHEENEQLPDMIKCSYYPTFEEMALLNEKGELVLTLNREDLSCFGERHWTRAMQLCDSTNILPEERKIIISHIRNKIEEKLGLAETSHIETRK